MTLRIHLSHQRVRLICWLLPKRQVPPCSRSPLFAWMQTLHHRHQWKKYCQDDVCRLFAVLIVGLPPCGGALAVSLFSRTSMLTSVTRQYGRVTSCVSVPVYAYVTVEYSDIAQGLPEFEDNLFCFCLDVVNGDIVAARLRHVQVVWNSGGSVERRVCQRPSTLISFAGVEAIPCLPQIARDFVEWQCVGWSREGFVRAGQEKHESGKDILA